MPVLHPYILRAVLTGVLLASCSSPVCRPALVEQEGRCVAKEVPAKRCEPACSPAAHEVCDGDAESPSCICAPGYSGIPCTWTGVLDDPGFQDQEAWTLSRGGAVRPDERGTPTDDGIAFFAPSVACFAGAVSQTVEMPAYDVAEPLVAEITYRAEGLLGMSLGFNRAWTQLSETLDGAWRTERVCLGQAAYGGSVAVQLGPREQDASCFDFDDAQGDIQVDRLSIVPADPGECPAPGEALNGTAELDGGGWQFEADPSAEAGLSEGAGREGTSGVRLAREDNELVAAWTRISVPSSESMPSPALRFWWTGTSGSPFGFEIGRFEGLINAALPLDTVLGNRSELSYIYCLPPWTRGNVVDLIFRALLDSIRDPSDLVIDDVEIVSDERCGTSTDVLDPGFEAGPARIIGVTILKPYQAAVTLRTDSSLAHTGDGALELSYSDENAIARYETWVLVPASNGNQGPAVVFWSNVPAAVDKPFRSVLGRAAVNPADVQVGGGWLRNEVCLFPEWSGRWFRLQFRLGDFPPMPDRLVNPPIRIYIDDLELTTSSACQAD